MTPTALHYLEYVSLFGKSSSSQSKDEPEQGEEEEEEDAHSLLDGTWRLAFNSGGAFPFKGARQDRWGYLKDDVEVRSSGPVPVCVVIGRPAGSFGLNDGRCHAPCAGSTSAAPH